MEPGLEASLIPIASSGDIDQIKTLLRAGEEPLLQETVQKLLTIAVWRSRLQCLEFLVNEYPSVSLDEEIVRAAIQLRLHPHF
jgi:hypothetical protein